MNSIRSRWALILVASSWTAVSNSWWVRRAMERAKPMLEWLLSSALRPHALPSQS